MLQQRSKTQVLVLASIGCAFFLTPTLPSHAQSRSSACVKQVPSPYALWDREGAPENEEFQEFVFTWRSQGYFALREKPRELAPIVDQVKGEVGEEFRSREQMTHILQPTKSRFSKGFEAFVPATTTLKDRTPKKRFVQIKTGDAKYGFAYTGEGTAMIGAINRHNNEFVMFSGWTDDTPDYHNPNQIQWWVKVKGVGGKSGWLLVDRVHLDGKMQAMSGIFDDE